MKTTSQKSYQQIAGDSTTDRVTGGDTAPASPGHTPEIAAIPGADETLLREVLEDAFATDTETEDQLCTLVASLFSHTETQRAEIKALRDALAAAVQYLEKHRPTGKIRDIFSDLNEYENGVMKPARAALKGATK
jgi:hypothetical protein